MKQLLLLTTASLGLLLLTPSRAQPIPLPPPSGELRFCGEALPDFLPLVSRRWQKTLAQRARYTDDLLAVQQRAALLFPLIEPILVRNAVPKDLKYLVLTSVEMPSRRGAAGIWQLSSQMARRFGLSVRRRRDQRYSITKSTQAACQYLWSLYRLTGSWLLAASAYRDGPTYAARLVKQAAGQPLPVSFTKADIQPFVYQALAYRELLTQPYLYGDLLGEKTMLALEQRPDLGSPANRHALLANLETPHPEFSSEHVPDDEVPTLPVPSLANVAVVVTGTATPQTVQLAGVRPVQPETTPPLAEHHWPSVQTRSLSKNTLTEGQLIIFEVTSPQRIDEVTLAVGDMVYANIELIDQSSGRVYLRADRVMSAQTRELKTLRLVAVEKAHQPGVSLPLPDALVTGWKLTWEKL